MALEFIETKLDQFFDLVQLKMDNHKKTACRKILISTESISLVTAVLSMYAGVF